MESVAYRIVLPTPTTRLYCHLLTDVHREAVGCDHRKFREDIEKIREANANGFKNPKEEMHFWIGGGDWNNGIGPKDKRFDATAVSGPFKQFVGNNLHKKVADTLIKEATPIAPWCWGYGRGNHEDGVIRYNDFDPADYVAQSLGVNYLGYSAGIRLTIGIEGQSQSKTLILYWHHGFGAARSKGGKMNMLYALRDKLNADVYMTGHIHEPLGFPSVRMDLSRRGKLQLIARPIIFVNGGTYQKVQSNQSQEPGYNEDHVVEVDYSEKAAYDPAVIGHFGWSFQFTRSHGRKQPSWGYKLRTVDFR